MSNPQDWMIKLPDSKPNSNKPSGVLDAYRERIIGENKANFLRAHIDFPEPLEVDPAVTSDPLATIAPALAQVELLEGKEIKDSATSSDPSVYYNGTEALEKMVKYFGLQKTIDWCRMTAYKYTLRLGKKAGNSVEQEAKKISDYLEFAESLQLRYDNSGSV